MNLKLANKIVDKARKQHFDIELYYDYSGRELFGTTITALTVNNKEEEAFVREMARLNGKLNLREDTLGKSQMLLY